MPFAANVEQHHKQMYADSVTMVAQQKRDPFAGAVTEMACKGEAHSVTDIYGAGEAQKAEPRSRQNPEMPVTGTRRWLSMPPMLESGQHIDREDIWANATDPTSSVVTVHTNRVRRWIGDAVLGVTKTDGVYVVDGGGILGTAVEGKNAGGATIALPGSQVVPRGATGLTLDKLRDAKLALQKNDFGLEDDDPLYACITPQQIDDLLAIAQAAGNSLNAFNIEQLKTGKPTSLLGITWINTNRVPVATDSATVRLCPIWSKGNIVRGTWQGLQGRMWNNPGAKNLPYVIVDAAVAATRVQDKGVIVIECNE